MRVVMEVRFDHFPQIADALRPRAVEIITRAVEDAETIAKVNAPVDTGTLRNSIMHDVDGLEGAIYTNVEYAPYQEYGTYKMAAHPFFTPAMEAVGPRFLSEMRGVFGG